MKKIINQSNAFYEMLEHNDRQSVANYFGVSINTLNKWVSNEKLPNYVSIILSMQYEINQLNFDLATEKQCNRNMVEKVNLFISAMEELKSL